MLPRILIELRRSIKNSGLMQKNIAKIIGIMGQQSIRRSWEDLG